MNRHLSNQKRIQKSRAYTKETFMPKDNRNSTLTIPIRIAKQFTVKCIHGNENCGESACIFPLLTLLAKPQINVWQFYCLCSESHNTYKIDDNTFCTCCHRLRCY